MECFRKDPRFKTVQMICDRLTSQGYQALLAGGSVRDGILGREPNDYDIATSATPDQVEVLFEKTVAVGKSFGVIVVVADGQEIEVATFRKDGGYQDGRRPDSIEFSSSEEDAKRRDFTINALFYDLKKQEVVDYVGGVYDIGQKKISAVGDPLKRFTEDHLRILRAVRFVSQLDFTLDANTHSAVQAMAASVNSVSGERIHQEILKLLGGQAVLKALKLLYDSGVLKAILKNSNLTWQDPLKYFSGSEADSSKLWSLWWLWVQDLQGKDFDKTSLEEALQNFKLSRNQSAFIKKTLEVGKTDFQKSGLGSLLSQMQDPAFQFAAEFFQKTKPVIATDLWNQVSVKMKSYASGFPVNYLQAADLPKEIQGPAIGEALKKSYEAQLEGLVKDKASALEWALKKSKGTRS